MWMDVCVHQILIRQQIAQSDRLAALHHMVQSARQRPARQGWAAVRQWVWRAAHAWLRHPVERAATR